MKVELRGVMKNFLSILVIIAAPIVCAHSVCAKDASDIPAWTWVLRKTFTEEQAAANKHEKSIVFTSGKLHPFSQLIFSWNATRPTKGHFRFMVQARNKATQKWGKWHTMVDWGADVQRSYHSKDGKFARYQYVRFELEKNCFADAFRIKACSYDGADLSFIKSFAVNVSNLRAFVSERGRRSLYKLPSARVHEVPQLSQRVIDHPENGGMCSPTSCSMLTSYFKQEDVDPLSFAHNVFDNGLGVYGSWAFNVAHAYEHCDGKVLFATARLASFKQLHQHLQRGIPVVVSVRGSIAGGQKVYNKGHLLLVVGYDAKEKKVICHDPAWFSNEDTLRRYPLDSFIRAWEASHRLAYIADPLDDSGQ